jgi:translation initiation factor 6
MRVVREEIFGTPFLGLYIVATEKNVFLPAGFHKTHAGARLSEVLGVESAIISIYGSPLIGVFSAANSFGMVVPGRSEKPAIPGNVAWVSDKLTALGNLILTNDKGAIISPDFSRKSEEEIRDCLGVEVARGTIAGLDIVGSCGIATNSGALIHPSATEDEIELIKSVLKVHVDIGSLNRGSGNTGACAIANSKGAVVGSITTPIEITRFEEALVG